MKNWFKKLILFQISQNITLIGSLVVAYAAIWYITIETNSGVMMTISILCTCLPQIFISLFAGVWADRYSRKLLIIVSDLFIAAATLVLAIFWLKGNTDLILFFSVMALRSFGAGVQQPAVNALIPQIVPVEHLTRVNAINATIMNILTLLAPALGGILLASGFVNALFFDVATAVIGVSVLGFLAIGKVEKAAGAVTGSLLGELKEGIAYVKRTDWLRFMLISYAIGFFLVAPASCLSPIFVGRVFGPEIWRLTANQIFWSVGAIIGGIAVATWGGFKNRVFSMGFSFLFFGITFTAISFISNFWIYLSIMVIAGFFLPMFTTAEMTFIQEKTEEQMMGRVFSLTNIVVSSVVPISMLIIGPLADIIDIRYIIIVSGLILTSFSAYLLSNKRLLALDMEGPKNPDFLPRSENPISEAEN